MLTALIANEVLGSNRYAKNMYFINYEFISLIYAVTYICMYVTCVCVHEYVEPWVIQSLQFQSQPLPVPPCLPLPCPHLPFHSGNSGSYTINTPLIRPVPPFTQNSFRMIVLTPLWGTVLPRMQDYLQILSFKSRLRIYSQRTGPYSLELGFFFPSV